MTLLFTAVLALYWALPTKDFYWDGVGFALVLQHPGWYGLVEANHPLYLGFASFVYSLVHAVVPQLGALRFLQGLNSLLGAAAVLVVYRIARELLDDTLVAAAIAGLFAFSATWWKFTTDSDAYIPAVLLLVIAAWTLLPGHRPRPVRLAVLHTGAMLFHELAVLFFLPAALGIYWQDRRDRRLAARSLATYLGTASVLTALAYYLCFRVSTGHTAIREFLAWITSHTPDSHFSFSASQSLWMALRGTLRLTAGGALNLFHSGPAAVFVIALLLGLAIAFSGKVRPSRPASPLPAALFGSWIAVYAAFLFFWMPQNTFYRLFYLPPLVLLSGFAIHRWWGPRVLIIAVALLGAWNYLFYIRPHSRAASNTVLRAALTMHAVWKPGTWIYEESFNPDDWIVSYMNPQVLFRSLGDLKRRQPAGREVWLDESALEWLRSDPQRRKWLAAHALPGSMHDFSDRKHRVRFVRLVPSPRTGQETCTPGLQ